MGLAAGIGASALWIELVFANPYDGGPPSPESLAVALAMSGLGATGAVAALFHRPQLLAVVACISLVPLGIYLGMTPGRFRWIGAADLAMLLAAALLHASSPSRSAR